MNDKIKNVFEDVITDIKEKKFFYIDKYFPFCLNINIENKTIICINENDPIFTINSYEKFINKLSEYINLKVSTNSNFDFTDENIKIIIITLFYNASYEDFYNPIAFINKQIEFIKNNNFIEPTIIENISSLENSNLDIKISNENLFQETPYKLDLSILNELNNEPVIYKLPSVSFGISNNTAYIYGIQKSNINNINENNILFEKKINRKLYKLNKNFNKNMDEASWLYNDLDNIYDVTHSSIASAAILISLLKKHGINNVEIISTLPARITNKKESLESRFNEESKMLNGDIYEYYKNKLDIIIENITTKFIRTFTRITNYTIDIDIMHYANEIDSSMHLNVNDTNYNNELLYEIDSKINNKSKIKKM